MYNANLEDLCPYINTPIRNLRSADISPLPFTHTSDTMRNTSASVCSWLSSAVILFPPGCSQGISRWL